MVEEGVEESVTIDFKSAGSLKKSDGKRREIGKDISSFANSAGGVIVYGLKELNHKASETDFIDGNIYTKELLEHVISGMISPRIEGVKIFPIRAQGDVSKTIYVVQIPKSNAVHMNIDNKYYKT